MADLLTISEICTPVLQSINQKSQLLGKDAVIFQFYMCDLQIVSVAAVGHNTCHENIFFQKELILVLVIVMFPDVSAALGESNSATISVVDNTSGKQLNGIIGSQQCGGGKIELFKFVIPFFNKISL